jgi:hypothetical protein
MLGKQNGNHKLENTVVIAPMCVTTSLVAFLTYQSQLSETSWKWKMVKFVYPFKAQWSLFVPPAITHKHSAFHPQSVFLCFVWFSQ